MTAVAATASDGRAEAVRWTMCFAVVVAAHGLATMALLNTPPEDPGFGVDLPVVMLDLPESFVAAPPSDLPEGPKEEEYSDRVPQPKEETKPPEPEAEVAIPIPEPPKLEPQPDEKRPTAPQANVPRVSVVRWQSQLSAHIGQFQRYPSEARARGNQGTVTVAFTIDHEGRLVSSRIEQSSGSATLDNEALAMLRRAQPMPRPPDEASDTELSVIVPVHFSIR